MADTNDSIKDIKARLSIVDVVQETVPLQRAGRNFKGLCPFHGEKTPSFIVYPESRATIASAAGPMGIFSALSCKARASSSARRWSGWPARPGWNSAPATTPRQARDRHRERLSEALAGAALYWHNLLVRGPNEGAKAARAYTQQSRPDRGDDHRLQLGYAPDSWDATSAYLRERGFSTAELLEAGLLVEREPDNKEAGTYDRFRNRLVFPIRDSKGRITGFGARALDDHPPKYLNSPQTPLYDKSATLYGIDCRRRPFAPPGPPSLSRATWTC